MLSSHVTPFGRFFLEKIMSLTTYLKETRGELKHVNWPTRKQAMVLSAFVIGVSLITAVFLGVVDYLFTTALKLIIG